MLDATLSALADPTRRAILDLLMERDLCVGEVVDRFAITQPAISRHLNVLEEANLIERRREGQRKICTLRAEPLAELDDWVNRYRLHWEGALERLDRVVTKRRRR